MVGSGLDHLARQQVGRFPPKVRPTPAPSPHVEHSLAPPHPHPATASSSIPGHIQARPSCKQMATNLAGPGSGQAERMSRAGGTKAHSGKQKPRGGRHTSHARFFFLFQDVITTRCYETLLPGCPRLCSPTPASPGQCWGAGKGPHCPHPPSQAAPPPTPSPGSPLPTTSPGTSLGAVSSASSRRHSHPTRSASSANTSKAPIPRPQDPTRGNTGNNSPRVEKPGQEGSWERGH